MLTARLLSWTGLALGVTLTLSPLAHAESVCITQIGGLRIGAIPQNPFTADVVVSIFQPHDGKYPAAPNFFISHISRDSVGRVAITYPKPWESSTPPEKWSELDLWRTMICDPIAGTTTIVSPGGTPQMDLATMKSTVVMNPLKGTLAYLNAIGIGLEHYREPVFEKSEARRADTTIDLGLREIEGIKAHGYRWSNPSSNTIREQWLSEELFSDIEQATIDLGVRTFLTHVSRTEPDPGLFQIPPSYKFITPHQNDPASTR